MLKNSRILAHAVHESVDTFPLPAFPEIVTEYGRNVVRYLLSDRAGGESLQPSDAHWALDEWLLSNDRDSLSIVQRAILGCALLEVFTADLSIPRDVPSIHSAVSNIWPAIPTMPAKGLVAVRRAVERLGAPHCVQRLDCVENAQVRVYTEMLNYVCKRQNDTGDELLSSSVSLMREHMLEHHVADFERMRLSIKSCTVAVGRGSPPWLDD